jgi:hypothetical protein
MTFDSISIKHEPPLPSEPVPVGEPEPPVRSWPRFEADEIDGSLCDLPLGDLYACGGLLSPQDR